MKVYLKLPIQGLEQALIEATGESVRAWDQFNTPEEWEDEFDKLHDKFTDLVPDDFVEVEFDLAKGKARVLLNPVDVDVEAREMHRPDLTEVSQLDLLDEDSVLL